MENERRIKMKWISVKEQYPDIFDMGKKFIVFSENVGVITATFKPVYKDNVLVKYWTDGIHKVQNVTHWMPMPRHPEGTRPPTFGEAISHIIDELESSYSQ